MSINYNYNYETMKLEDTISAFHTHLSQLIKIAKQIVTTTESYHIEKLASDIYIARSSVPDFVIRASAPELYELRGVILNGHEIFNHSIDTTKGKNDKSFLQLVEIAKKYRNELDDEEKDEILSSIKVMLFSSLKYMKLSKF